MEWVERLNNAIEYIEKNLENEISAEQAAKVALCSSYHFQRIFSCMTGVTLSEYIRRRRMTIAASELLAGAKVIDTALKFGYESPTSFTRAFQAIHGITPSQAKSGGVMLKAFQSISFKLIIKGDTEMNYRIEKKNAFRIIGISEKLSKNMEENFTILPKVWKKAAKNGTLKKIVKHIGEDLKGVLGVSVCGDSSEWKYFIAAANETTCDNGFEEYIVPAATWAVFSGEGAMPEAIQQLAMKIMTEWLPSSGYEYANTPEFELYLNDDVVNAKFEIWLPVTKKI